MWPLLGKVSDQQKTIVEERLKALDKELAKAGKRAGYAARNAPPASSSAPQAAQAKAGEAGQALLASPLAPAMRRAAEQQGGATTPKQRRTPGKANAASSNPPAPNVMASLILNVTPNGMQASPTGNINGAGD